MNEYNGEDILIGGMPDGIRNWRFLLVHNDEIDGNKDLSKHLRQTLQNSIGNNYSANEQEVIVRFLSSIELFVQTAVWYRRI